MAASNLVNTNTQARVDTLVSGEQERAARAQKLARQGMTSAVSTGLVKIAEKHALDNTISPSSNVSTQQLGRFASAKQKAQLTALSILQSADRGQGDAGAQSLTTTATVAKDVFASKSKLMPYDANVEDIAAAAIAGKGYRLDALRQMRNDAPTKGQVFRRAVTSALAQSDECDEVSNVYDKAHRAKRFKHNFQTFRDQRRARNAASTAAKKKAKEKSTQTVITKKASLAKKAAVAAKGGGEIAAGAGAVGGISIPFLLLALFLIVASIFGSIAGADKANSAKGVDGLPPYITEDMVITALECQEKYGHPAGCTLAQIICESGVGDHLSGLATTDSNLFGIKWSSFYKDCEEVSGYSMWPTAEQNPDGSVYKINAPFIKFKDYNACIRFRSRVFLQGSRYANNPLIREAIEKKDSDKMAEGLKDAGYATSISYVESLKKAMDTYDLRRFDGMSVEEFKSQISSSAGGITGELADGSATPRQQAIVRSAYAVTFCEPGWCAKYVSLVFQGAGMGYPGGNACDMYRSYCHSSSLGDLKPGMIIAVDHSPFGQDGWLYGHIGIYIGNGKVRHNDGRVHDTPLKEWISTYSQRGQVKWGWVFNIDLSK